MSLRKRGARWSQPVLCSPITESTQKPVSEPVSQLQAGPSLLPPDLAQQGPPIVVMQSGLKDCSCSRATRRPPEADVLQATAHVRNGG